jgi:predicted phosphodiesterase
MLLGTDYLINSVLDTFILDKGHRQPDSYLYVDYHTGNTFIMAKQTLPEPALDRLRIAVIGDTHDRHQFIKDMPECDLFIHCGDILMIGRYFTTSDVIKKLKHFNDWLDTIPAKKKIVIAGNHDHHLMHLGKEKIKEVLSNATYLENDGIEFQGVKIWGSPISRGKSQNTAFQSRSFHNKTMQDCPEATDILITHGHYEEIQLKVKHKLHLCGHRHNSYGVKYLTEDNPIISVCAPIHDGHFRLKHRPVIIDFPKFHDPEKGDHSQTANSQENLLNQIPLAPISFQAARKKPSLFSYFFHRKQNKIVPTNISLRNLNS